jgi:uncharacterized membrane protein
VYNFVAKKKHSKTGVIVGAIVGGAVLGLLAFAGIFVWRQKRRKQSQEQKGIGYTRNTFCVLAEQRTSGSTLIISFVMSCRAIHYCGKT